MNKPLVSIIVPVYNGSNFIAEALKSAINQTYQNVEIIVINDGSNDGGKTKAAVEPFLEDPRVRYIEKPNGGVSSALNLGIKEMKGEFFSWLSHDDVLEENSLSIKYKRWVKLGSKQNTIISTQTRYMEENGDTIFRLAAKGKDVHNVSDIISSTVNGCSLLIPKSLIENKTFKEGMIFMQDYFLWADLVNNGAEIKVVNRKLTNNRVHEGQITTNRYDLLVRDFCEFAKTYIDPLMEQKDYKQLKEICFTFAAHLSTRPFYESYLKKYVSFLKKHKKWTPKDNSKLKSKKFISWVVGKTRSKPVMAEPNNKLNKLIFVTNYAIFHQTGVWDEFVKEYPEVDFTFLCTEDLSEERKSIHYVEETRPYIIKSTTLSDEELAKLFDGVDIVLYGLNEDPRVDKYITKAKHLVVESEHLSGRKGFRPIIDKLSRWRYFNIKHKNWKKMDRYLLAMSYFADKDYAKYGFKDKTYRFGYFPKLEYKEEARDPYKLLWFGRNLKWKRARDAVYALKILHAKNDKYTLDIVGEGPCDKQLRRLVKKYKLESSVNFFPFEEHDKIIDRARKAGIVFFASDKREGWGVALNEMLSQKSVVFANTNAGSTLYLANKKNSFIYNNRKVLKEKLNLYLSFSDEEITELRENAYSTINDEWNNHVSAHRIFEFFTSVVRKERKFTKYENGPLSPHKSKTRKYISTETNAEKIEHKSQKNMAIGTVFGYLTVALAVISGLILIPKIMESIGANQYGIYGLATSLVALFMLDFGLATTTNTYLAKLRAKNDKDGVEKFLAAIFKIYLILDIIFIVVIIVLYFLIDIIYKGYTPAEKEALKPVLLIVGGYSVVSFPTTVFSGALSAYEKFGFNKFSEFINKALYLVLTLLCIKCNWGLIGLVCVNVVSGITAIAMRFFYMRYYMGIRLRLRSRVPISMIKTIFKFSGWALVLSICARLIFNITPSILAMVSKEGDGSVAGATFTVITTIEGYIYTIGAIMSSFFMAKIARTGEEKNNEQKIRNLQSLAEKVSKFQFVIIVLIVVGWVSVGQEFLAFWKAGSDMDANTIYLGIIFLCISEIVAIPEIVFETAMYTENHIKPLAINAIVKAAINLGLSFYLSAYYGALGSCIAIACARIINLVMNNIVYRKYLHISLTRFLSKLLIRGLITLGISLCAGLLLHYYMPINSDKWKFLIDGFIVVGVYVLCTFFITFNLPERYFYARTIKNFFKRKKHNTKANSERIKVLEYAGDMDNIEANEYLISNIKYLNKYVDITFVVSNNVDPDLYKEISDLGIPIKQISQLNHVHKFKKDMKALLKAEHYNIVHSHIDAYSYFPLKSAIKYGCDIRFSQSHITTGEKDHKLNFHKFLIKLLTRNYANVYIAPSEHEGARLFGKSSVQLGEIEYLLNSFDFSKYNYDEETRSSIRKQLNIKEDDILVGCFDPLIHQKNQSYILKLAKQSQMSNPEIKYLLIGSGENENALKKFISLNNLNNVILLPETNGLSKFYNALDVYASPSLKEDIDLNAIKGQANGLFEVLSTNVPSNQLIASEGIFLSIDNASIPEWINAFTKHNRNVEIDKLKDAGYDAQDGAEKLLTLYSARAGIPIVR